MIPDCYNARIAAVEGLYHWLVDSRLVTAIEFQSPSDGMLTKVVGPVQSWDFSDLLPEKAHAVERLISNPVQGQTMDFCTDLIAQNEVQPIFRCDLKMAITYGKEEFEDSIILELRFAGAFVLRQPRDDG